MPLPGASAAWLCLLNPHVVYRQRYNYVPRQQQVLPYWLRTCSGAASFTLAGAHIVA
jgi:hypothetical protein